MSAESICQTYHEHLQTLFGDSVAIPEEYHWEWATIPHLFEYPFYVYAYNFGNLMVMALYQHYRSMGNALVPKIKDMLRAGSVMSPIDITNIANISLHDPDFWRQSLAYIESLIDELEELVDIKKTN
jgi:oligoendopeptidase F